MLRLLLLGLGIVVVVVALALRHAGRNVPRPVILVAWPGQPELIGRLLGAAPAAPGPQVQVR